jgi:hypothetical protein
MDRKGKRESTSKKNQIVPLEATELKVKNEEKIGTFPSTKLDFSVMASEFNKREIWDDRTNAEIWEAFATNFLFGLLPVFFGFRDGRFSCQ